MPFGTVRFRDFFFADVLTSMTKPLADIGFIVLHLGNVDGSERKDTLSGYLVVMAILPFWWRFG